jgi:uncharacterized protein YodC (DUF2158 family)
MKVLKVGDTVRPRATDEEVTIAALQTTQPVLCSWTDENGNQQQAWFRAEDLEPFEPSQEQGS